MARTALILGAGIGGIVVAETLRKLLPAQDRVLVVERERTHVFAPSLLWHMTGDNEAAAFTRPLAALSAKGIELVTGAITRIDPASRTVEVDGRSLSGDALVVALGADYATEAVPGLAEAGHNLYTLPGAQEIRAALEAFEGGRIVVLTAAPAYKCPAAPYEAAMLVAAYCKKRSLRKETTVAIYAAEPAPMLVTGPVVGGQVMQMLERKGIAYFPSHQVTQVEAGRLHFANDATAAFDLLLYVAPHRAPAVVKAAGLCADSGWIAVDRETMETQHSGVYAIGDVTSIPLKMGRPLPKAGVFANGQAQVVARNIARAWTGKGEAARFDGHGMCFLEVGGGMAGVGSGNFYAEPTPDVRMRSPNPIWHLGKVLYEKYWLWRQF
ncbi:MAG: pyridine nucleotide-disulfide oxidoreductase [Rhodocyclales bacterium RIFCSPLOWO2_02_FULL_63_24]|nr:MAG: pyridine nucleotide-disulfide oxidoreductase [Rhodocyclales bacterium RIFCSPLOWO2_02_FULL_63_24]